MTAVFLATPRLTVRKGVRLRLCAAGSAAKAPGYPPESALAVSVTREVVAMRVLAQDRQCIPLVRPLSVETGNEQTLDLRQGGGRSFL